MDFARKQLEKYGWKTGKGLGKQENGITEAIKPKLKRSVAGIGHDAASEFTEHWWKTLYDKAAQNVEIEEENGAPKRFKAKEEFEITNSTWKLSQKNKSQRDNNPEYFENFVKKAVLTSGGTKLEAMSSGDDDDGDEQVKMKKDVLNMTDEELFAACGGRTAHKGARHGLRATGKLARIEQQEQKLLTSSKFAGYTTKTTKHNNKNLQIEELTLSSDTEKEHKKKKKKYCNKSSNSVIADFNSESTETAEPKNNKKTKKLKNKNDDTELVSDCNKMEDTTKIIDNDNFDIDTVVDFVSKKKKKADSSDNIDSIKISKKKKGAKKSDIDNIEIKDETVSKKKKNTCEDYSSENADEFKNEMENTVFVPKKKKKRSS